MIFFTIRKKTWWKLQITWKKYLTTLRVILFINTLVRFASLWKLLTVYLRFRQAIFFSFSCYIHCSKCGSMLLEVLYIVSICTISVRLYHSGINGFEDIHPTEVNTIIWVGHDENSNHVSATVITEWFFFLIDWTCVWGLLKRYTNMLCIIIYENYVKKHATWFVISKKNI